MVGIDHRSRIRKGLVSLIFFVVRKQVFRVHLYLLIFKSNIKNK